MKRSILVATLLTAVLMGCALEGTGDVVPDIHPTDYPVSELPEAGEPLDRYGRYHGFIRQLARDGDEIFLDFEVAELLSGDQALQAAIADGAEPANSEGLPNDFYVRNPGQPVRSVELSANPSIRLIQCPAECESVPVSDRELEAFLEGTSTVDYYGTPDSLFDVTFSAGQAIFVHEEYLP